MKVKLDYGSTGLEIDVPADVTTVVQNRYSEPVDSSALVDALQNPIDSPPLHKVVERGTTVGISVCDMTRPQPRIQMLNALLSQMPNVKPEDITVFIASGAHKQSTPDEIEYMLGSEIANSVKVVVHNAYDTSTLMRLKDIENLTPVLINREWMECDIKLTTGFVEPHFFAGFSGGPKMVAPGLAGLETILELHNYSRISNPFATWGIIKDNPIHSDIRKIAEIVKVDFGFDVTLNRSKQITGVFAGNLFSEHKTACAKVKETAMCPIENLFDVVVTSNSGYPLDQNLYQSVKGMSAAAQIVKQGGTIICAAECRDGLPDHGSYADILYSASSTSQILNIIANSRKTIPDQWQAQIQALIQQKAQICLKSYGLTSSQIKKAHLTPIDDISKAVKQALEYYGKNAKLCVLPEGPQSVAYFYKKLITT